MRQLFIMAMMLMTSLLASAQNPETIETFAANYHETEWYGAQAQVWQKVVDANPQDEWAWRNLFRATYYYDTFTGGFRENQDHSRTADVLRKMEATLPDSFVLNLCKCRFCLTTDADSHTSKYIIAAITLMPKDVCAEDNNYLANRLWAMEPESRWVSEMNQMTYRNKYFPDRVLRYNWNMLRSMEPGSLYFSNGDNLTTPMKLLQDATGERADVCVIPLSFLHLDSFRDALCNRLGIQPIRRDINDYANYKGDWTKQFYADVIMYLIRQSKRPAYFSTDLLSFTNLDKDSLYNEGMLLKYSNQPYNNFAVAMHNVKEVYHLEYLTEPDLIYNDWETSNKLDMNYVTLLSHLVPKLRNKGETAEAKRLYNTLKTCVERCDGDPEFKAHLMSKLEEK